MFNCEHEENKTDTLIDSPLKQVHMSKKSVTDDHPFVRERNFTSVWNSTTNVEINSMKFVPPHNGSKCRAILRQNSRTAA